VLNRFNVLNNPVNLIDPYGLLFGLPAGEGYGESAAEYYAGVTTDPCASGLAKAGAWVGGLFASLWTPETSNYTALTLIGAYAAGAGVATEAATGAALTAAERAAIIEASRQIGLQGGRAIINELSKALAKRGYTAQEIAEKLLPLIKK